MFFIADITDADIFALRKPQLKNITVHVFSVYGPHKQME